MCWWVLVVSMFWSGVVEAKMQRTTWQPDTCDCEVIYEWDDTLSADQRVHRFVSIVKPDNAHTAKTPQAQYDAIMEENQRKNQVLGEFYARLPITETVVDFEGNDVTRLKAGIGFTHSYDAQRILHIQTRGLTALQRSAIQTVVDQRFGVNRVKVD